jgi:hypothetical protein
MKMKPFEFREIIDLLNNSKNVSIDEAPMTQREGKWALYRGRYKVHTSTIDFEVLYLGADATHDAMDEAHRHFRPGDTQVVYASSLDGRRRKYHQELFGSPANRFWTTKSYLQSFIREELDAYLDSFGSSPDFYIDPQVTTPIGTKGRFPNPLLAALRSPRFEEETAEGLIVLLGEPGQGKTYMSQFVVSELAKSQSLVPVYISSAQWESMPRDHLGSLQKTITHSFRYFETPISWLEGQEDRFLRTTLRADLFRIVFDGFDEYILRNEGRVGVSEALDELTNLAKSTGARILITSRSSFWESNIDETPFVQSTRASVYRIAPFDLQHAKNYFSKRFSTASAKANQASGVYATLVSSDPEFVGRGFVLKLVGDLVSEPGATVGNPGSTIRWLVEAFCERETLRQKLPLNGAAQLLALETFAAEVAMGATPDSEALEVCIGEAAPQLTMQDRMECLKRMQPHPLLEKDPLEDEWRWSQEQIGNVFLAEWVCRRAVDSHHNQRGLAEFLRKQKLDSGQMNDLASMIVDLAVEKAEHKGPEQFVAHVVDRILSASRAGSDTTAIKDGRTLATTIAMKAVDKYAPSGTSHQDRASMLLKILHGPPVTGVAFSGAIARMDFSGVLFRDCRFDRVMWANVRLDEHTVFEACHFVGGIVERTNGLGLAEFKACTWDSEAEAVIRLAEAREGRRKYGRNDLKADIGRVIGKFVSRGGFLQTVEQRNMKRGTIRGSKYADDVIETLVSSVLESHHISGVTEGGYNVREDALDAVRFFASNGVLTGRLKDVYDSLVTKLRLD